MIGSLAGQVAALEAERCVIEVNGVGYLVHASPRTLAALPRPPATARVLVETLVREDAIQLVGFATAAERDWFRLLTTVQGVGARVALGVLGALSPEELAAAIATGDTGGLTRAPGVGPRLAARLATELRDRVAALPAPAPGPAAPAGSPLADALSALANLGYRRAEAQPALERAAARLGEGAALDALLRETLRELAR
jgi:holliday junction DNA helicase RuvA